MCSFAQNNIRLKFATRSAVRSRHQRWRECLKGNLLSILEVFGKDSFPLPAMAVHSAALCRKRC